MALLCDDARYAYGRGRFSLGPVTLDLQHGVVCVVGPNGAGKSTLFRLLSGQLRPHSGSVRRQGSVGYLPQEIEMPAGARVDDFLRYVAWVQCVPRSDRQERVDQALDVVGLADRRADRVGALSGGMKRRLGIAQAIVHAPAQVLLDEPTAGLDPVQRVAARTLIRTLGDEHLVVVATHLVEDVRAVADRVLVLGNGRLTFDGTTAELEKRAHAGAAGDSVLERAVTALLTEVPA